MIVKAALFDLDGTLLDTEALSDKAILNVFRPFLSEKRFLELNHRLPWECKKLLIGLRGEEWTPIMVQYAKENWIDDDHDDKNTTITTPAWPTPEDLLIEWEKGLQEYCVKEVEACLGAYQMVESLTSQQIPMAIATSSRSVSVAHKRIRQEKLFSHFQVIVTGDDPEVKNGKPAPDIYLLAAKRLGVDPKDCIVFEDALSGVRSGKAAGCTVVVIPNGHCHYTADELQVFQKEADIVLTSFHDWNDDLEQKYDIHWQ